MNFIQLQPSGGNKGLPEGSVVFNGTNNEDPHFDIVEEAELDGEGKPLIIKINKP